MAADTGDALARIRALAEADPGSWSDALRDFAEGVAAELEAHQRKFSEVFRAMADAAEQLGIRVELPPVPDCDRPPQALVLAGEAARRSGVDQSVGLTISGENWAVVVGPDMDPQEAWDGMRVIARKHGRHARDDDSLPEDDASLCAAAGGRVLAA